MCPRKNVFVYVSVCLWIGVIMRVRLLLLLGLKDTNFAESVLYASNNFKIYIFNL